MGKLFSFEGIDNVGKTTQVGLVQKWLEGCGYAVKVVREPGGTPLGEGLRSVILGLSDGCSSPLAEFLVFSAARAELVTQEIRPHLETGGIVLADRYMDSSVAYQAYGRGLNPLLVQALNHAVVGECVPVATFWLDGQVLSADPADAIEGRDASYFLQVEAGFHTLAQEEPYRIFRVAANRPVDEVFADIQSRIRVRLH